MSELGNQSEKTVVFTCGGCNKKFYSYNSGATECGYCQAERESAERSANGGCAYGWAAAGTDCIEPGFRDGKCVLHYGYTPELFS